MRRERHHPLLPIPGTGGGLERLDGLGQDLKLRRALLQELGEPRRLSLGSLGVGSLIRRLLSRSRRVEFRGVSSAVRRRHLARAVRACLVRLLPRE